MAAGDLALTILLSARDVASPVFRGLASSLRGMFSGAFASINSGLHDITSGFLTMYTGGGGAMASLGLGIKSVASGLLMLSGLALLAGAAIGVAIGIVAIHAAADFQQGLNRLVTGAGDVTDNMQKMGQSILGVSVASGVMTGELLPAMYQIISAGQRGAQAENTLAVAAKGSVVEQANVVDVAKALTTAMTDYGTKTYNATQFMNGYTRATQLGKLTLEQLSTSMGPILPLAKNIGVSFADVAGAMSTMTNAGIPADRAATSLRFLFQSLENPTKKATTAMTSMGLSSVAVGNELKKSLPGALEMIYKAALKAGPEGSVPFNRAVSDMIGGQRSLSAYLALTGTHFATYSANVKAIAAAMNGSKTAVLGWDVAQGNLNVVMNQGKAAFQALLIIIGTALLPVITRIAAQIGPLISRFGEWLVKSNALGNAINAVTPFFATMFDTVRAGMAFILPIFALLISLIARLVQWVTANKTAMEAFRIIAIALGVALLAGLTFVLISMLLLFALVAVVIIVVVGVVMLLIIIAKALAAAWVAAVGWIGGAWHTLEALAVSVFNAVKNAIVTAFNATISWIVGAWHSAIGFLVGIWHTLAGAATSAWNAIKNAIVSVVNAVISWLVGAWHNAIAFLVGVWNTLRGAATSAFNAIKSAIITAVQAVISWLVNAWNTAVHAVVAAFQWLYNHNYYFKNLVDAIVSAFNFLKGQVIAIWNAITSFLVGQWNALKSDATSIWNGLSSFFTGLWNSIKSITSSVWNAITSFLVGQWNALKSDATSAWNAISSVISSAVTTVVSFIQAQWNAAMADLAAIWNFLKGIASAVWNGISSAVTSATNTATSLLKSAWSSAEAFLASVWNAIKAAVQAAWNFIVAQFAAAWGRISGPLHSLGASISGFFSGLANQAISWGRNIISGIVNGINSMIGAVRGAASNIASTITGILGFHSPPKEGPARDADTWMPNMVRMLTSGIAAGGTQMHSAVGQFLSPLAALSRPLSPQVGVSAGGRYPTGSASSTPISITVQSPDIYLDGANVTQKIGQRLATEIRRQGGVRSR